MDIYKKIKSQAKRSASTQNSAKVASVKRFLKNQQVIPRKHTFKKLVLEKKDVDSSIGLENKAAYSSFFKKFILEGKFLVVLCFLFFLGTGFYSFYLMQSKAKRIVVSNDSEYDVLTLDTITQDSSFFGADNFEATNLLNNQPLVKKAKLKKFPPQLLAYFVEGRKASLILSLNDQNFLLDDDFVLIHKTDGKNFTDLPRLVQQIKDKSVDFELGFKFDSLLVRSGVRWINFLQNNSVLPLHQVAYIDITDPYKFIIHTKQDNILVLTTYNYPEIQIDRLSKASPALIEQKSIRSIDLRVKGRVIVSP